MDSDEGFFQNLITRLSVYLTVQRPLQWVRRMQLALLAFTVVIVTIALAYPNLRQPQIDLSPGGPWEAGRNAPRDFIADTEIEFVLTEQFERARRDRALREPLRFTRNWAALGQPGAVAYAADDEPNTVRSLVQKDLAALSRCRAESPGLAQAAECIRKNSDAWRRLDREQVINLITLPDSSIADQLSQTANLIFQEYIILSEPVRNPAYAEFIGSSVRAEDLNRPAAPQAELPLESVVTRRELMGARVQGEIAELAASRMSAVSPVRRRAFATLASAYLGRAQCCQFNVEGTLNAREQAAAAVSMQEHLYKVARGQPVVRLGEVISANARTALELHQQRRLWELIWRTFGIVLQLAVLTGLLLYFALRFAFRQINAVSSNLIIFLTLWLFAGMLVVLERLWMGENAHNELIHFFGAWTPMGLFAVLFALIFGETLAILLSLYLAMLVFIASKYDGMSLLIALSMSLVGAILGARIKKRVQFITASAGLTALALALVTAGYLYSNRSILADLGETGLFSANYKSAMFAALLSSGLTLTVIGLLPVYETLFNIPTRFKLQELADPSHPLLQEMFRRAPSTWQHTLMVSAMVEKACERLNLNVQLARTGIYFHDIGKMKNAGFFIENQHLIPKPENIDKDNPQRAARVIIDHVLDGIKMAELYRLPREVIAFIPEHHGTSTMAFFYHKALEKMKRRARREDFRYPGPIPQSKETGIAMIADSVEAAGRSLDEITEDSVNNLIQKIINIKLAENQLDESGLTVGDLRTIREAFKDVLLSALHSRPKYPDEKDTRKLEDARTAKGRAASVRKKPNARR